MHGIIENIDVVEGIEQEWHGLTSDQSQEHLNCFENGALDWSVIRNPIYRADGSQVVESITKKGEFTQRPIYEAVTTLKNGDLHNLHICRDTYGEVSNKEFFDVCEILILEFGFNVASIGSVEARKTVFFSLEADSSLFKVKGNDPIYSRVNGLMSHCAGFQGHFYNSATRQVCLNTIRWALKELKKSEQENLLKITFRRTSNVQERIKYAKSIVSSWAANQVAMQEAFEELASKDLSRGDLNMFSIGFSANGGLLSTRALNVANAIRDLAIEGKGNEGKTRYDALNGVTEYYTSKSSEDAGKTFFSSEFGVGAERKERALVALLDDDALNQLCEKGEKLLKNRDRIQSEKLELANSYQL